MNDILKKLGNIGLVPVVKIDDASRACGLAQALIDGELLLERGDMRTDGRLGKVERLGSAGKVFLFDHAYERFQFLHVNVNIHRQTLLTHVFLKKTGSAMTAGFGGNMWESNPPKRLFTPITGFEDQGAHQHPSTPECRYIIPALF